MRAMAVRWEIEHSFVRIEGDYAVWTFKNVGDEDAPSGSSLGSVTISHDVTTEGRVETTPYTNAITLDRDVAAGTAHPMSYPLSWTGQEVGNYRITIMPHDDVYSELRYRRTLYGVELDI
jgi:hypothetical protein